MPVSREKKQGGFEGFGTLPLDLELRIVLFARSPRVSLAVSCAMSPWTLPRLVM